MGEEKRELSLLQARLRWERENPRPVALIHAERMIVRALNDYGFGRQYQVTRDDGFEIAVDDLVIQVKHAPEPVQADGGAHGSEPGGVAALNQTDPPPNVSEVG